MIDKLPLNLDLETKEVLLTLKDAHRYLAELKGVSKTIPNESILISTLPLLEAKDSSAIENIITTHDELYKSTLFEDYLNNPAAKEIDSYAEALKLGFKKISEKDLLTNSLILEMQEKITNNSAGFRVVAGTKLLNNKGECVYEPPQDSSVIKELMKNLEEYINDDSLCTLDPLIKMAIIHHQFESIHPFYDGNGRTGRIINILYLVLKELLDLPVLYLSHYIIETKNDYYTLLQKVRNEQSNPELYKAAWQEWICYILKGIISTSKRTVNTISKIRDLMQDYKVRIRAEHKFYSQDLLNILFSHPYTKVSFLVDNLGINRKTATKYLDELTASGFLSLEKLGNSNFYINQKLFNIFLED